MRIDIASDIDLNDLAVAEVSGNGEQITVQDPDKVNDIPRKISARKYTIWIWHFVTKGDTGIASIDGINRDALLKLIQEMGYFKRYKNDNTWQYIHEKDNIISAVELAQIRDAVTRKVSKREDIRIEDKGIIFEASAELQRDTFFRNSPSLFCDAILGHLPNHEKPLLHDTDTTMYFPFKNCIATVTREAIETNSYSTLNDTCIWEDHIIKESFEKDHTQSQYYDFIMNVCNEELDRYNAFMSAIGYLLHNYSHPTKARAVVAYDQQLAGRNEPAGGTGKGVFIQAIRNLRTVATIDGKKLFDNNRFSYQSVNQRTQVIFFDDVKPDFDFFTLNSTLTEGWTIELKNKQPFTFDPFNNPKAYITSNTILKAEGTTAERRQFVVEFSDYYSSLLRQGIQEPIIHIHGATFFSMDWDVHEWNRFFSFMLSAAQYYLQEGLQFYDLKAVHANRLLQNTSDDFANWCRDNPIPEGKDFNITDLYMEFKSLYHGEDANFQQQTFTKYLKTYARSRHKELEISRKTIEGKKYSIGKVL